MIICQITTVHNRYDDRIFYKQCSSIASQENKVYLIANSTENFIENNVEFIGLKEKKTRFGRFFNMINAFNKSRKLNADIYHLHDPELIIIGLLLKLLNKKVIFDFHELVFFQIKDKEWLGRIRFFIAFLYKFLEKLAVKYFDGLILAEDGYFPYVKENYNKYVNKFVFIRNFPILELINQKDKNKIDRDPSKFILIYAGGLSEIRGIYEVISSLDKVENVELWLLGPWESEEYELKCSNLKSFNKVKYFGVLKMKDVYGYMKLADVGISTLYPKENYLTSLPVKAFEYMACGLPIIMSNFELWQKMFSECALFVNPKDENDISDKINILKQNKELILELGLKSKEIVNREYSWETESKRLISLYKSIYAN